MPISGGAPFVFSNGLIEISVIRQGPGHDFSERRVTAREAFVVNEALTVLSILVAQSDLERYGRMSGELLTAVGQAERILKEAGR